MACGILVPWPGIEPVPPAVEVQSLNYWTTREVPQIFLSLMPWTWQGLNICLLIWSKLWYRTNNWGQKSEVEKVCLGSLALSLFMWCPVPPPWVFVSSPSSQLLYHKLISDPSRKMTTCSQCYCFLGVFEAYLKLNIGGISSQQSWLYGSRESAEWFGQGNFKASLRDSANKQ